MARQLKFWNPERRHLALLLTLLGMMLFQPLSRQITTGWILYDVLSTILVLTVLFLVYETPGERILAGCLAGPAIATNFARYFIGGNAGWVLEIIYHCSLVVFLGTAAAMILRGILRRHSILGDDVLGALCSYLLLGMCWASIYQVIILYDRSAFTLTSTLLDAVGTNREQMQGVFTYFSFTTLTTLGYGDVTPVSHLARTFSWLEAAFGQFYIAVVVAQIVGMRLSARSS